MHSWSISSAFNHDLVNLDWPYSLLVPSLGLKRLGILPFSFLESSLSYMYKPELAFQKVRNNMEQK